MSDFIFQPSPNRPASVLDSPETGVDVSAVIQQLADRILKAEQRLDLAVDEKSLARIILTNKDILIEGDQVSVLGQLNIADWIRDVSGNPTGGVDASSMTKIVGGKIQTGVIYSANWSTTAGSKIDLNQGIIALGGSSAPKFQVDNTGALTCTAATITGTLQAGSVITNSCTVDGVTMNTIKSNAALGATAYSGLSSKLEASTSYILSGIVDVTSSVGGFKAGTIAWNSSTGAITGGSGIAITRNGIIGASGGVSKFAIDINGNATFKGDITGASGTFAGNISSAGYISATGGELVPGYNCAIYGGGISLAHDGIVGSTDTARAVYGLAFRGTGVEGACGASGGYGVKAIGSNGATALAVQGPMSINNTTLVTNLNADTVDGWHFGSVGTGSATASFLSNKPGSNSSNTWIAVRYGGSTYYLAAWT